MDQESKVYRILLVMWIAILVLIFCYVSHLEAVNEVRDYPNEHISDMDARQLARMMNYHGDKPNLQFFE